MALDSKVTQQ